MSDNEINLLDEISDDPDDRDSDYGRGYREGAREMARSLARTYDIMRIASEQTALTQAARAYEHAANTAQRAADRYAEEPSDAA